MVKTISMILWGIVTVAGLAFLIIFIVSAANAEEIKADEISRLRSAANEAILDRSLICFPIDGIVACTPRNPYAIKLVAPNGIIEISGIAIDYHRKEAAAIPVGAKVDDDLIIIRASEAEKYFLNIEKFGKLLAHEIPLGPFTD